MGEFSVYWWMADGTQIEELRLVSAERAVRKAKDLTNPSRPCNKMGLGPVRLIITDAGDCCTFEWLKDKGIVFPPQE